MIGLKLCIFGALLIGAIAHDETTTVVSVTEIVTEAPTTVEIPTTTVEITETEIASTEEPKSSTKLTLKTLVTPKSSHNSSDRLNFSIFLAVLCATCNFFSYLK